MSDDLTRRQNAAARVEKEMLDFLMQFTPARELRVSDVNQIATFARIRSFDAFSDAAEKSG